MEAVCIQDYDKDFGVSSTAASDGTIDHSDRIGMASDRCVLTYVILNGEQISRRMGTDHICSIFHLREIYCVTGSNSFIIRVIFYKI